ncbi:MAG: hypothetical protein BAJALOKI2v1_610002 [Promethearchaeota archaeon]|nr:MAG: hypothetical protein BAJALOKI2v1_610002 [Candidatus Lokiarchaeota archaeon]
MTVSEPLILNLAKASSKGLDEICSLV